MIVNITTEHINDGAKEILESYGVEKFKNLEKKLLRDIEYDSVVLTLNLRHVQKHNAFILKVNLDLPGKLIHYEEAKHVLTECIDLAYENVKDQVTKYMEQLHGRHGIHGKKKGVPLEEIAVEEEETY